MGLPRASGITQQTGWGSNQSSHSASITTSKIPRQLWLVGLWTRHLAHTRKVAGSILGRCHQIFQFHYISCFLWCRFRKSWSGVQKTPQKCSRSPPKSRFLTLPDPRIRLLPKAASTPLHPKSFPALPNVYPDPGSPLFSSEKAPKSRQKSGKTTQNGSFGLSVPPERAGRSSSNFKGASRASKGSSLPNLEFPPLLVGSEFAGKDPLRGTFQKFFPGFYAGFTG